MAGATAARKLLDKDINIKGGQDILISNHLIELVDVHTNEYKIVIVHRTIPSMLEVHGSVQNRRVFGSYVKSRGLK